MYEMENTNRNRYYLNYEAYIYRKQNMSIYKKISIEIPIENNNVNQVYNS